MNIRLLCDFLQFAHRVLKVDTSCTVLFVNLIKGQKRPKTMARLFVISFFRKPKASGFVCSH